MADNNGKVTTREFYDELKDVRKEIADYHTEVKVALARLTAVEKEQVDQGNDIDDLQSSNVRWAGLNSIIAAIVALVTGWFVSR